MNKLIAFAAFSAITAAALLPVLDGACSPVTAQGATQGTASGASEAFTIEPSAVQSGAKNLTIRLVASQAGLFASNSAKTPELKFGTGIEIAGSSFKILNPNEAQVTVNVADSAVGGVAATVTFFSQDGSKAVRQEKATVGIVGPFAAGSSGVKVGVADVLLVRVNVPEGQAAGDIILTGKVNGQITVKPPAGTLFVQGSAPAPAATAGSIENPRLDPALGSFTFSVANPALADTEVRIAGLKYDTSKFTAQGGAEGNLSTQVSSVVLGQEAVLVVNAHTALKSLKDAEIPAETPAETPTTQTGETSTTTPATSTTTTGAESNPVTGGSTVGPSSRNTAADRAARERARSERNTGGGIGPVARENIGDPGVAGGPQVENPGIRRQPNVAPAPAQPTPAVGGGGGSSGSSGGGGGSGSAGGDARSGGGSQSVGSSTTTRKTDVLPDGPPPVKMRTSRKLYFADKDYQPIAGVALEQAVGDERRGRVWVVLDRSGDDISPRVDTVRVSLRIGVDVREILLTETGPTTGIFRSEAAGIEIAAIK